MGSRDRQPERLTAEQACGQTYSEEESGSEEAERAWRIQKEQPGSEGAWSTVHYSVCGRGAQAALFLVICIPNSAGEKCKTNSGYYYY